MSTTIEFPCPNCNRAIRTQARHAGRTGQCPNCGRKVTIPGTATGIASLQIDQVGTRPSSTEGSVVLSLFIGAAGTAGLYVLFFLLKGHYLGDLFVDRGPVQYFSTFVTCSGLAMLALKYRAVKQQLGYAELELELIPLDMGMQITPGNVEQFIQHLDGLPTKARQSILGRRIRGALEHFRARNHVPEIQAYLASSAQLDASSVESGYTLLRAFIWAVPILGFIGTVVGISGAVGKLADQFAVEVSQVAPADAAGASNVSGEPQVKSAGDAAERAPQSGQPDLGKRIVTAMTGVTHNLATAFDTTFVALVFAIALLFPTESLRKTEYAMLDRVESFANESLLRRMSDEDEHAPLSPEMAKVLEPAFQEHQRWLVKWQTEVGQLGELIGKQFEQHITPIEKRLGDIPVGLCDAARQAALSLTEATREAAESSAGVARQAVESLSAVVHSVADAAERFSEASREAAQDQRATIEAAQTMQELLRDNSRSVAELVRQCPDKLDHLSHALDRFRETLAENSDRLRKMIADGKATARLMSTTTSQRGGILGFWRKR